MNCERARLVLERKNQNTPRKAGQEPQKFGTTLCSLFYKEFFMAIEDFVRDFNRHLDDAIGKAMEGDVADAVRTAIVSAVESEVYSERVYKRSEDHPYVRRDETGEPGGLQDRNVM